MIRVKISPPLIEQILRAGFKLGKLIEVIDGLPLNAQLYEAAMEDGMLALYFTQPTVPNTELQDLSIVLKSIQAVPVDLEKPVPVNPRHAPVMVTKEIR